MATLFHFPCFLSLYYRNLLLAPQQQQQLQQQHKLNWATLEPPPRKKFTFCACSTKKSTRGSRKVKSNAELCNDIREFVTALGLPEDHVPSMKELSQHGRKDLANIVRRRGYKLIRELVSNSTKSDSDGPNPKKSLDTNQDEIGDHEHILTDISYGLLNESGNEERKKFVQPQNFSVPPGEEHSEHMRNGGNAAVTLNDQMLTSKHVAPDVIVGTQSLRDDLLSSEELMTAELDKDLDRESGKREKQAEINQLRFMLHQKELELSRLREQIKKEQLALSDLQTKAKTEIRKAQKFISEKDAELQATEESLSGLKEVQIQFHGDGEIVEVSGSFNGWHHHIKLDPQPPCSTMGPVTSRQSRLWATVLWLYPGMYEIKFIVDGHWKIDPQRESFTRGNICNNVLRVENW